MHQIDKYYKAIIPPTNPSREMLLAKVQEIIDKYQAECATHQRSSSYSTAVST